MRPQHLFYILYVPCVEAALPVIPRQHLDELVHALRDRREKVLAVAVRVVRAHLIVCYLQLYPNSLQDLR